MSILGFRIFSRSFIFNASSQTKLFSRRDINVKLKPKFLRHYSSKSVTVTFVLPNGTMVKRSGKAGETVRSVVKQDDPEFPGYGGCNGGTSCGGCHVILSKEDFEKLGTPGQLEEDELYKVHSCTSTSRLACAMELGPEIDGIVLKIPKVEDE